MREMVVQSKRENDAKWTDLDCCIWADRSGGDKKAEEAAAPAAAEEKRWRPRRQNLPKR